MSLDLLAPTRFRRAVLEGRLEGAADSREVTRLLLESGRHDEAWERAPRLAVGDLEDRLLAARTFFAVGDYDRLAPLAEDLAALRGEDSRAKRLAYRWAFATDDLARVDSLVRTDAEDAADHLAAGRLAAQLHDFESAQEIYEHALAQAPTNGEKAAALAGLGVVFHRRQDFGAALDRLLEALALTPLDPAVLTRLAETLIRLGRTGAAVAVLDEAVACAPYDERAHYLLGNGYTRLDYTRLAAARPDAFAAGDGRAALQRADEWLAAGQPRAARRAYEELARAHPEWADVAARLGSLDFDQRRYAAARRRFADALGLCPDYGRAHNGLAKALEAARLEHNVHRRLYATAFAAAAAPEIDDLERYVVNWRSLAPRHRKQVALSVAPWARYVPVLLASGATHYIKPLHQRLSDSPDQDLLRDQRISYDSRLWDDVRGCGGYHTVTGVEDVERIPMNGYNTVLHELTHQVHQVLPSADRRRIQELYRRAKERDESGGEAFLSRYAGGSVWEYFAEGANALASPRRDRYDSREIVRQRLEERDPELWRLVIELMDEASLDGPWMVAWVTLGSDHLRRGRPAEAIAAYREALARIPDNEDALGPLIYALGVAGRAGEALELAAREARRQPESADLAIAHANSSWLAGRGLESALAALAEARAQVRGEERFQVDLQLGSLLWTAGRAAAARAAYEAVVAYQADHPQGLWGLASAQALDGRWSEAWARYEEAVCHRSGIVDLRIAYAWDLLRAGELEPARRQLDAALLLEPGAPEALALEALWHLAGGDVEAAEPAAERALELGPWSDLARLALAKTVLAAGRRDDARRLLDPLAERLHEESPPEYVYRPEKGSYVLAHTLPAVLRAEVPTAY